MMPNNNSSETDGPRSSEVSEKSKSTIQTFALASFLNDLGSDMIYPIWPLFVTSFLGANMAILGLLDGIGEAIVSLSQAASGYLSDRWGKRKIFIWIGYLLGAFSRIGYALSTSWGHLIPPRILDRFGKIRGAPRDAIVADVSTATNRGKNFGILRMMDNLGAVFGIVLCIILFKTLGYRRLFVLAAVPSFLSALIIGIKIKEHKQTEHRVFQGIRLKNYNRNFRLFTLLNGIFAVSAFSYSFLLVFAERSGFHATFVPVLYLIFTAVASVTSLPFGRIADTIGRKSVMLISFILWMLVCAIFILMKSRFGIIAGFVFYGLHRGSIEPVQKTFVAELSPEKYRASSLGGFQMIIGMCALPASLAAGFLWDYIGATAPFVFSIALTLLSVVLLLFVRESTG